MVANIVLNASTTAASGTSLDISSAAEVLRPTSRPLGPNGFTQLMRVFPFITRRRRVHPLLLPMGQRETARSQNPLHAAVCPIEHESRSLAQDYPASTSDR